MSKLFDINLNSKLIIIILLSSVFLMSLTELRFYKLIGIGEILILILSILIIFNLKKNNLNGLNLHKESLTFWLFFIMIIFFSYFMNYEILNDNSSVFIFHLNKNLLAFIISFFLIILFSLISNKFYNIIYALRYSSYLIFILTIIAFVITLFDIYNIFGITLVDGLRFEGFAKNSNQLVFCLIITLIFFNLSQGLSKKTNTYHYLENILFNFVLIFIGICAKSYSFYIAILIFYFFIILYNFIKKDYKNIYCYIITIFLLLISLPIVERYEKNVKNQCFSFDRICLNNNLEAIISSSSTGKSISDLKNYSIFVSNNIQIKNSKNFGQIYIPDLNLNEGSIRDKNFYYQELNLTNENEIDNSNRGFWPIFYANDEIILTTRMQDNDKLNSSIILIFDEKNENIFKNFKLEDYPIDYYIKNKSQYNQFNRKLINSEILNDFVIANRVTFNATKSTIELINFQRNDLEFFTDNSCYQIELAGLNSGRFYLSSIENKTIYVRDTIYDLDIGPVIFFEIQCEEDNIKNKKFTKAHSNIKKLIVGKIKDRVYLGSLAFDQIKRSPIYGFGPGALTYDSSFDLALGKESHNSFTDLTIYSGFLGLFIYLSFLFIIFKKSLNKNNLLIFGALLSLLIFSMFHNILRHPIYWISLFMFFNIINYKLEAPSEEQ